ncbi:MAG: ABC transporter permease [Bacteroidales bacterium]|nr:ABC transporter permease [Bacteroidales bacterium]MDD2323613.1 ABC transporter permease [Bacteroidales bacterium]MDD3011229.1 ABC transporter permease [Bacteroidales bacterium]MDD3961761.1 ABC transporter permease [Bacteroidales bacterium]MDY0286537.1 ABC transporter permease [Bacteroidales bacterium]
MNKIGLILQREYMTRVKKRSFIIMTILGPVLMAAVFIIPMVLAMNAEETSNIAIVDETGLFATKFNTTESLTFSVLSVPIEEAKTTFVNNGYDDLLYIPKTEVVLPTSAVIFSENQVSITTKTFIRNVMRDEVEEQKMLASGIDPEILKSIKTSISLTSFILDSSGEEKESYAEVAMAVGYVGGLLIYMFIFIYGSMVMRGVIEEKTSRIIEIIISSVKPFQLMMGKIIGIALVGLTQFLLWIVLTAGIVGIFNGFFAEKMIDKRVPEITQSAGGLITENTLSSEAPEAEEVINEGFVEILEMIRTINIPVMLISFIFYFLGGYLLYASMFAAIGAAVDNETDTQQFMLPITVPIILALVMMPSVIENPSGSLAIWLSMIPFTSPISMMMRIPFGVPYIELVISAIILVFTFVGMTWAAGKIYRTGILMYGKKVSYKELWKWIRYNG